MNKLQAFSLAVITAAFGLNIISPLAAQAASFTFDFAGQGQGSLSFQSSPLTGEGEETISLYDLSNLAEDVYFDFSFPTYVYGLGDANYGDDIYDQVTIFNFSNGKLVGIDFGSDLTFTYAAGGKYSEIFVAQTLYINNNRFTELRFVNESTGGSNCDSDYYYDPETEQTYEAISCSSYGRVYNATYDFFADGISYQTTSLTTETITYQVPELNYYNTQTSEDPYNFSGLSRFDELPQITFITLVPINRNDPTNPTTPIPEPEPFSVVGLGTILAGGIFLKQIKSIKERNKND